MKGAREGVRMAGKKRGPALPGWFRPDSYRDADSIDAGDWLLNLTLRHWLDAYPIEATEAALRLVGPVLKRADAAQIKAMHEADIHRWVYSFDSRAWPDPFGALDEAMTRPHLQPDVWHALRFGCVPPGIVPLSVLELYWFEGRLPDDVRKAGAKFKPGDSLGRYPMAFRGTLDDAFGPTGEHQMTSRFLRVNLSLPDDVLHADLDRYLKTERHRLGNLGGPQPYREGARIKRKAHDLSTLARLGLLQFLDLDRWQKAEGLGLSANTVRGLAGIDRERSEDLLGRVADVRDQFRLHAWFARLERSASLDRKR